jgi:predicted ATP-grasp superfamily ATP-dependent carboligase
VIDEDPLQLYAQPDLRSPTLMLAYAGWNDAGEAATTAVRYLLEQLDTHPLACIDTETFFDFTVVRPHVRQTPDGGRHILWPNHEFFGARLAGGPGDLLLGFGIEPHLRWKAYTRCLIDLARRVRVERVILLGAFLADVIYSQPIQVNGSSTDPELSARLGFRPSSYEGPTGVVGVLSDALRREGIEAISLWASLPHYVSLSPNARGALALLHQVARISPIRFDASGLERQAAEFDAEVSELIASDPQLTAYVRELKKRAFSQ